MATLRRRTIAHHANAAQHRGALYDEGRWQQEIADPSCRMIHVFGTDAKQLTALIQRLGEPATAHEEQASLMRASAEVEVLLSASVPALDWSRFPRLRLLQTMGAGVDELIGRPLPECAIATAKGLFAAELAEYVVGALLFHLRGFGRYSALQADQVWQPSAARLLQGQRGCLIGVGAVGSQIANRLRAFNVQLDAVVRHPRPLANLERVVGPEQRMSVLSGAEFLVIAAPLTNDTRGLIGAGELAALARRAIVINVGRGPIIDESALADALCSGLIGGAVLDVFSEEPLPPESGLWNAPNTLVTPHVAGLGLRYGDRCVGRLVENVARLRSGLPMLGPFVPGDGY